VEVVDTDDLVPPRFLKCVDDVRADVTGATGDQDASEGMFLGRRHVVKTVEVTWVFMRE